MSNRKKKQKISISELIMKILAKQPKSAEEIRAGIKDRFGYNVPLDDICVYLLRLLRRDEIQRKKVDKIYQYHI